VRRLAVEECAGDRSEGAEGVRAAAESEQSPTGQAVAVSRASLTALTHRCRADDARRQMPSRWLVRTRRSW
jgi:hypothetical protein